MSSLFFPVEGRDYLLDVGVHGGVQIGAWYVALYEGDYEPQESDTAANIGVRATEITAYAEGTRPEFVEQGSAGGATNNQGNVAQFTMTAEKTVRMFALVSSGGRVFCVTALGDDLEDAQRAAYAGVEKIRMDGGFYRKDIGQKGINRLKGK